MKGNNARAVPVALWRECGAGLRMAVDRIARRTTKSKSEAG